MTSRRDCVFRRASAARCLLGALVLALGCKDGLLPAEFQSDCETPFPAYRVDGRCVGNPYPVDSETQAELLVHFAENIQPILEQDGCMDCHQAGRFGMIGFRASTESEYGIDEAVWHNYWDFLLKGLLNFEKVEGSRALAVLRGNDGVDDGIPGVYHMNRDFLPAKNDPQRAAAIYAAFKEWIEAERRDRTPEGVGTYWAAAGGFTQLCWIARDLTEFSDGSDKPAREPQIHCQAIDENHDRYGERVDITSFLAPDLPAGYDLDGLVANYGEAGYKLYTSLGYRDRRWSKRVHRIIEIDLEVVDNRVTGARFDWAATWDSDNPCLEYRVDETGETVIRCADERLGAVYPFPNGRSRLLFSSDRGMPYHERVTSEHPDPADPNRQRPEIPWAVEVNWTNPYNGSTEVAQIYSVGTDRVPKLLLPNRELLTDRPTIGPDGKVYSAGWFVKSVKLPWLQQFYPDFEYGNSDLLPPFLGKSLSSITALKSKEFAGMAAGAMGQLLVAMQVGGVEGGTMLQALHHDLGAYANPHFPQPADAAPVIQTLRDTGDLTGAPCDPDDPTGRLEARFQGLDRHPITALDGATFLIASTNYSYDTCSREPPPALGIWKVTHRGDRRRILTRLPEIAEFPDGWFVDGLALLTRRQLPPIPVSEEVAEPDRAVVHIPNVWAYLTMRDTEMLNMDASYERYALPGSPTYIDAVRVVRSMPNPGGHADNTHVIDHVRKEVEGQGGFHGTHLAHSTMVLGEIPVNPEDGSVAFEIPARMAYFLQFLTTIQTAKGPVHVAVQQNQQIHVARPGYNEHSSPIDMQDYSRNCMRCHGSRFPPEEGKFVTVEELTRKTGGEPRAIDRSDTLAMRAGPVDLRSNPVGPYPDYAHMVAPALERHRCTNCHGATSTRYGDDADPPGTLSFEPLWADTDDPAVSSRWTTWYPQFVAGVTPDLSGQPMGPEAPWSPGYVLLQRADETTTYKGVRDHLMLYLGQGERIHSGASWGETPMLKSKCGLLLYVLGVDLDFDGDCSEDVRDFDGFVFVRPEERYKNGLRDPVTHGPFDHRESFSLEEIQAFLTVVDLGWDYNGDFTELRAPSYGPFAGQPRMGLAPEL